MLACLAFIVLDIASFRQTFVRYVSSQARIIETNTVSALLFDDPATALGMNLAVLQSDVDGLRPNSRKALKESAAIVKDLSRELRTLSHLLHPPQLDIAGLRSALRWYVQGFAERSGIRAELDLPSELDRLPRDVEMAVFRIVQESLTNVHRHSESPTATVGLHRNGTSIRVEVRDHGRGFPSTDESDGNRASLGIGIQGMRERVAQLGGEFEIRSGEDGTCVVAIFPG